MDAACVPKPARGCLLLLQAGNVVGGAFDDFETLVGMAREVGVWVHVDGAFGLWAAASEKCRHLVRGVEGADSWSFDAHKTQNAGYDSGMVHCRHREALVSALGAEGTYLPFGSGCGSMLYTTEMSRRARTVPLWAALKSLGKEGVARLVDRLCENARLFAEGLQGLGFILDLGPVFNQLASVAKPRSKRMPSSNTSRKTAPAGAGATEGVPGRSSA